LEKQRIFYEKMQEQEKAIQEAQLYENRIDIILSVHRECGELCDWASIQTNPPPEKPSLSRNHEEMAQGVNGGLKVSNSGGIKLSTCQSLGLKTRGHVDDRYGGVPHVARFIQQRIEHQRDRQTDRTQPCDGAEASEFSDSPFAQKEIQETKQIGWPQGIHNR